MNRRKFLQLGGAAATALAAGLVWRAYTEGTLIPKPESSRELTNLVWTKYGPIRGEQQDCVHIFRGVPYATPPIGDLRWKPPREPHLWKDPRDAINFGPACPQRQDWPFGKPLDMSEDCLYLNLWTPAKNDAEKLPVMAWIHGGGFYGGSASQPVYDGFNLATHGVVVVSFDYRLGPFGFLAHPALAEESEHRASGNYGLMDQVLALKWIHENIHRFGGDPANVTVFGESAGAISVCALMTSSLATGLFDRAIAESGGALMRLRYANRASDGLESMESLGNQFAKRLGVQDEAGALKAMRSKSWQEILGAAMQPSSVPGGAVLEFLCVDGYVLQDTPGKVFANHKQLDIPFMTGTCADEGSMFARRLGVDTLQKYLGFLAATFGSRARDVLNYFPAEDDLSAKRAFIALLTDYDFVMVARTCARDMMAIQHETFLYQFTRGADGAARLGLGVYHGAELPYVFGSLQGSVYGEEDRRLSQEIMGYWTRFARTGDPNGDDAVTFPRYDSADRHLILGVPITTSEHLHRETCDFLETLRT